MITKEEEDDEDDDGEEDDEDVQKAMEEARRILEIRRSQWSGADSRRRSSGSVNRESLESSDKRTSISSSSKRLSQLPLPEVTDAREKKRESIRNSWWSATGVGAGVSDPAVLEAQARREEERRSWWSGDGAVTPPSENRRSYLSTSGSDKRRSVVDSEGKRRSTIDPEGRLSVDPDGKKSALDTERRPLGGEGPSESPPMQKSRSRAASRNRKSWWLSTADVVAEENEDENGDSTKIETKTEGPSRGAHEADKDQEGASGGDASGSK
ncbi:hypothetical protein HK405_012570 [Cladochytrium tenue]|nr:hypothetical protein HK405_012570 [Cladochytrium tenue]